MKRACHLILFCAAAAVVLPAQSFNTFYSFTGLQDGGNPHAPLLQGMDGSLYGSDQGDSTDASGGVLFKITPSGAFTTIYNFCPEFNDCPNGSNVQSGLIQAQNGSFYGTATYGGTSGILAVGTVFELNKVNGLTQIHSFCSVGACEDGFQPYGGLVQGFSGNFYGTTYGGGSGSWGTIYEITPSGTLTTLYSFACPNGVCANGADPQSTLVQGKNGDLFGTAQTDDGSLNNEGSVFKVTTGGVLTTLYTFCVQQGCPDGEFPNGLMEANDGNFYGTTRSGGTNDSGTVFQITPAGVLTTLYKFCASFVCTDGQNPTGSLIQGSDGNLYGTTQNGGSGNVPVTQGGTMFQITLSGVLKTVYNFCSQSVCQDGSFPGAGVTQYTDGDFYGTTFSGGILTSSIGPDGAGTIFHLSLGLQPIVKLLPGFGKAGSIIDIFGTNLTGATSVTFDGVKTTFQVISNSLIVAKVPNEARSGAVAVTTPRGTILSNVVFQRL